MMIGMTPYLNAYPFHLAFQNGIKTDAKWFFAPPAQLNAFLRNGTLDASLISSIEYLQGDYHFLAPFGIVAKEAIHSVNFYVKKWSSEITCHVTQESATSVALLKVLAKHFWNVTLNLKPLESNCRNYDSFLLIGNQALEAQNVNDYQRIDLAKEWHKHTGKEFVFALFATRKITKKLTNFCQKLQDALHWSETHFEQIMTVAEKNSSHSSNFLRTYYQSHTYCLSDPSFEGLNLFAKLLQHV